MDEHVAQRSVSGLNMDEATRESADASYSTGNHPSTHVHARVSGAVGLGLCLFPPTWVVFWKARPWRARRSAPRSPTLTQEDFRRDVRLIFPSAQGSEEQKIWAVAKFDTGSESCNFISEHLIRHFHGFIRYDEKAASSLVRCPVRAIDGRELEVLGEVTLRWKGEDKRCRNKSVFMHPKYFTSKFLVVPSHLSVDVVIGLETYQDESLNEEHPTCWYGEQDQGGRRQCPPQVPADTVRNGASQTQQAARQREEADEAAAESEEDRRQEERLNKKKRTK